MLVFMLNLHWWSHAGSCFKKSRASSPGRCRYEFPRARVTQTSCSSDGVELARRAPFEFVNGFNPEMMLAFKSNHDIQVLIGGLNALLRIYYATKYVTKMQEQVDSPLLSGASFEKLETMRPLMTTALQSAAGASRHFSMRSRIGAKSLRGSCAYMSVSCATLPLQKVLHKLVEQAAQSCDLVELREYGSDVTFRASFLDDYLFRPARLDHLSLYEYVAQHFRRKRTPSTTEAAFFLPEHPLFNSHCVGTHTDEVVPVVAGMRMPFVDSESPFELVVKRSQCALVLFKPFRAVEDLVVDSTDSAGWVEAFLQWQPTCSSFTCEIMANMDDYFRAAKQATECSKSSGEADNSTDIDELTGTSDDVDAALDRAAGCESLGPVDARSDDFCHIFDDDSGGANSDNDDESAVASTLESSLPIFPNSGSYVASVGYQDLLSGAAQKTVGTVGDLRSRSSSFDFSIDELHRFVSDTSNDETEPQRSGQFRNERPTEVVELITSALDGDREWSPPSQPLTQPPPPLGPYASIEDVARAFTLNLHQYAAFTLITISLLRRFLCQELGGFHGNGGGYRTTTSRHAFVMTSYSCSSAVPAAPAKAA